MSASKSSPQIASIAWGRVEVEGSDQHFKDAKLYPGGAREWDWNESGTRHVPGIQPADTEELLDCGATHVVLSKGMNERLQVGKATFEFLQENGVQVDVLETNAAVARYNELARNVPVGALIHSTC